MGSSAPHKRAQQTAAGRVRSAGNPTRSYRSSNTDRNFCAIMLIAGVVIIMVALLLIFHGG
jgi:hypothetical protein